MVNSVQKRNSLMRLVWYILCRLPYGLAAYHFMHMLILHLRAHQM